MKFYVRLNKKIGGKTPVTVCSAYEHESGSICRRFKRKGSCIFSILKCWCLVCSEGRDGATAAWLQRAGQVGDELERAKQGVYGTNWAELTEKKILPGQ